VWGCLDLWYGYDWWNGTCSHSQFVSFIVEVILKKKRKKKKKKKWSDGGNCVWYYKLSMFIIPPKILIKGSVYTWYIQIEEAVEWSDWFTCLIYSSLSWFIFAPLVSMALELHSQIFSTLILNPVTTLEKSLWFMLCMWPQRWRMRRYASLW
jgi:hypothetical protein